MLHPGVVHLALGASRRCHPEPVPAAAAAAMVSPVTVVSARAREPAAGAPGPGEAAATVPPGAEEASGARQAPGSPLPQRPSSSARPRPPAGGRKTLFT